MGWIDFFIIFLYITVEFYWWGWIDWWGGGIRTRAGISFVTLVVDWHYVRISIDFDAYKRSLQHPEILKILNLILDFFLFFLRIVKHFFPPFRPPNSYSYKQFGILLILLLLRPCQFLTRDTTQFFHRHCVCILGTASR